MDLRTFYQQQTGAERDEFAAAIGTSPLYYRNIAYELRNANDTLALAIERESRGKVTVAELRPKLANALAASGYRKRRKRA